MYSFGSLTSQALEVMTALIQGNFVHWMDTRGNYVGGGFHLHFCGEGGASAESVLRSKRLLIPRLRSFSESLSDYRIQAVDPQFEDSMVGDTRFVIFHLKHQEKSEVMVKITFQREITYPGDKKLWGKWRLAVHNQTVFCYQHPDSRFHGKLIVCCMPEYSDFGLKDPAEKTATS